MRDLEGGPGAEHNDVLRKTLGLVELSTGGLAGKGRMRTHDTRSHTAFIIMCNDRLLAGRWFFCFGRLLSSKWRGIGL